MPRLEEQESKKLYYFRSKNGKRLQKFSGDEVSNQEISEYEIPEYLLEKLERNDNKKCEGIRENPSNKINRQAAKSL